MKKKKVMTDKGVFYKFEGKLFPETTLDPIKTITFPDEMTKCAVKGGDLKISQGVFSKILYDTIKYLFFHSLEPQRRLYQNLMNILITHSF